jgi:hypothetical protein
MSRAQVVHVISTPIDDWDDVIDCVCTTLMTEPTLITIEIKDSLS